MNRPEKLRWWFKDNAAIFWAIVVASGFTALAIYLILRLFRKKE